MDWEKLGQIYQVNNSNPYLLTHASNPLPLHLDGDVYRIFYNGRNPDNKSSVSYVDINIITYEIVNDPKTPILTYGDKNSFYSHGISIGNVFSYKEESYIGFMGWQIRDNNHWRGDLGKFEIKRSLASTPSMLLDKSSQDPISTSYPYVVKEGNLYKMWYGSTINWTSENGEMIHVLKYAESFDTKTWVNHQLALPYIIGKAQAFSRPTLLKINNTWNMWYSYRSGDGTLYRIGHATSNNGKTFNLNPTPNLTTSPSGWDSEMVCYPYVFRHQNKIYMLYNGNDHGKEGFGLAVLKNKN
jgi:hypothetical protein